MQGIKKIKEKQNIYMFIKIRKMVFFLNLTEKSECVIDMYES